MRASARVSACAALVVLACGGDDVTPPVEPTLLEAAIEAHGGAAALERLDDLRVRSRAVFREGIELDRTLHYRAPSSLAMILEQDGAVVMSFGLAGDRCWQRHGAFVLACTEEAVADHQRIVHVLAARSLHGIGHVTDAGTVVIDGVAAPALRAGELRLAFDPESHLLIRIDYTEPNGPWVESYADFVDIGGARVARQRALTIAGEPDVTETWTEIVPGGADDALLTPPEAPVAGAIFEGGDAARPVVWVDPSELAPPPEGIDLAAHVRAQVGAFAEGRGMRISGTDAPIFFRGADAAPRIAITLENDRQFEDLDEPPFHLTTWPAGSFVGIYHRGQETAFELEGELAAAVSARGWRIATSAAREFLLAPDAASQPAGARFGLFRVRVER